MRWPIPSLLLLVLGVSCLQEELAAKHNEDRDVLADIFASRERDGKIDQWRMSKFYDEAKRSFSNRGERESELYRFASETEDPRAQYELGALYARGTGSTQSDEEAVRWWNKAAKQGDMSAQYSLALMHHSGRGGMPQSASDVVAFKSMLAAAEQGHVKAQLNTGWMFYKGRGVTKNEQKAAKWFERAAQQGLAAAQFELSLCYKRGVGVPQSDEWGKIWFSKATSQV
jgi:TPR repeat protein